MRRGLRGVARGLLIGFMGTRMALANLFRSNSWISRIVPFRKLLENPLFVFQRAIPFIRKLEVRSLFNTRSFRRLKRPLPTIPLPPKRPVGPYNLFFKENFHDLYSIDTRKETLSKIAELWNEMPADDREGELQEAIAAKSSTSDMTSFQKKALNVRCLAMSKDYAAELQKFLENEIGDKKQQEEYFISLKKYRSDKRKYLFQWRLRARGLVKPATISAYNTFVKERCALLPIDERKDYALLRKAEWHTMDPVLKQTYTEKAEKINRENFRIYREKLAAAGMETISDVDKRGKAEPQKRKAESPPQKAVDRKGKTEPPKKKAEPKKKRAEPQKVLAKK